MAEKIVSIDKLKHFDKLEKRRVKVTPKMGKAYEKWVQKRKEESPKPKRQKKEIVEKPRAAAAAGAGGGRGGGGGGINPNREKIGVVKRRRKEAGEPQHNGVDIRERMSRDSDFALENMLLMQEFQTEFEHKIKGTKFKNMVGFNKPDAEFFADVMDQISKHAGLGRYRQALGSNGQAQVERQIQGRMLKYSNQLADIFNDNNRYRNFKTIRDQLKEAKNIGSDELNKLTSLLRGHGPSGKQIEREFSNQSKNVNNKALERIHKERKRGPKQQADGIAKRFDNAKHAAEVYYQMREIARNPDPHFNALYDNYMRAKDDQYGRLGRNVDDMMANGFEKMNMKEKNIFKGMMKELAPQITDMFNAYKEHGMSIPKGQAFRGKNLKQIRGEEVTGPPDGDAVEPLKRESVTPDKGIESEQAAFARKIEKFQDGVLGKTVNASDFNRLVGFDDNAPAGINETYVFKKGSEEEGYFKPFEGQGDSHVKEAGSYELAKMMGLDHRIAPTRLQSPDNGPNGKEVGSMMMSTRQLAKKLGYNGKEGPAAEFVGLDDDKPNVGKPNSEHIYKNLDGFLDMAIFDYVTANIDRHKRNQRIAHNEENDRYVALPIDHGYVFYDQAELGNAGTKVRLLLQHQENTSLSRETIEKIKSFDEQKFYDTMKKIENDGAIPNYTGGSVIPDQNKRAVAERVMGIRDYLIRHNLSEFTVHDLANVIREKHPLFGEDYKTRQIIKEFKKR